MRLFSLRSWCPKCSWCNRFTISGSGTSGFNGNTNVARAALTIKATEADIYSIVALDENNNVDFIINRITGQVEFNVPLSKPLGSFKIDHPLDPEIKYPYYSFVILTWILIILTNDSLSRQLV